MPAALSVSTAAYDGYELADALDSLARLGATAAVPVFGAGSEALDEDSLAPARARRYAGWLRASGLACEAVVAPVDFAAADPLPLLRRRLEFARTLGAPVLLTSAPQRRQWRRALPALEALAGAAQDLQVRVGLADADGQHAETAKRLAQVGSPWLGLDFHCAHALLGVPGIPVAEQLAQVLPHCVHLHLSDLRAADGWFYTPPGEGEVGCDAVLRIAAARRMPVTLDLPLRRHRTRTGLPSRAPYRVPLADIEAALARGIAYARARPAPARPPLH